MPAPCPYRPSLTRCLVIRPKVSFEIAIKVCFVDSTQQSHGGLQDDRVQQLMSLNHCRAPQLCRKNGEECIIHYASYGGRLSSGSRIMKCDSGREHARSVEVCGLTGKHENARLSGATARVVADTLLDTPMVV